MYWRKLGGVTYIGENGPCDLHRRMSGGCIKLDLVSILQGYGFLTMLPLGDLLNFGDKGNNYKPLPNLVSISVLC